MPGSRMVAAVAAVAVAAVVAAVVAAAAAAGTRGSHGDVGYLLQRPCMVVPSHVTPGEHHSRHSREEIVQRRLHERLVPAAMAIGLRLRRAVACQGRAAHVCSPPPAPPAPPSHTRVRARGEEREGEGEHEH